MYSIDLLDVISKFNIRREEIVQVIEDWFNHLLELFRVDIQGVIPCYYKRTWGSCRRWIIILFEGDEPVWSKYSGRVAWYDNSSRKNPNKLAVIPLDVVADKELVVYFRAQPSCNRSKWFSFKAKIMIHKLPAETMINERPRLMVDNIA